MTLRYSGVHRLSATPAPARWTTASTSASTSGSNGSPGVHRRSAPDLGSRRTRWTTSSPRVTSDCDSADPMRPEAPVIATRISTPSSWSYRNTPYGGSHSARSRPARPPHDRHAGNGAGRWMHPPPRLVHHTSRGSRLRRQTSVPCAVFLTRAPAGSARCARATPPEPATSSDPCVSRGLPHACSGGVGSLRSCDPTGTRYFVRPRRRLLRGASSTSTGTGPRPHRRPRGGRR